MRAALLGDAVEVEEGQVQCREPLLPVDQVSGASLRLHIDERPEEDLFLGPPAALLVGLERLPQITEQYPDPGSPADAAS